MTLPVVFALLFLVLIVLFFVRDLRQGATSIEQREQFTRWIRLQQEPHLIKGVTLQWHVDVTTLKKQPAFLKWTACDVLVVPEGLLLLNNWKHNPAEALYIYRDEVHSEKYDGALWKVKQTTAVAAGPVVTITFNGIGKTVAAASYKVTLHFPEAGV